MKNNTFIELLNIMKRQAESSDFERSNFKIDFERSNFKIIYDSCGRIKLEYVNINTNESEELETFNKINFNTYVEVLKRFNKFQKDKNKPKIFNYITFYFESYI